MRRETFTDFDAFRATNPQVDGEWLINGGTDWRWITESLNVGQCYALRCYLHTGVITEGVAADDSYQFYVPFKNKNWRNNGVQFHDDSVLIIEPGVEHCVTTSTADGWHGFLVPRHLVEAKQGAAGEPVRYSYLVNGKKGHVDAMRCLFGKVIAEVSKNSSIESSPAMRMVETELRCLLLPLLRPSKEGDMRNGNDSNPGRPRLSRCEILRRSQAVLEEFDSEPVHVSELAERVGVSERSLRTVFNEHYQIGPRRYLLLRQLHKVHANLLVADPDAVKVTDVLTRWGVWQFGRFAGLYKAQFGELPNETLHRRSLMHSNVAARGGRTETR
jgi:AraC family ethanolamine operon transcriptional activator